MDEEYHSTLYGVSPENLSKSANRLAASDVHMGLYMKHHKIAKDAIKQSNSRLAEFHAGRATYHDEQGTRDYMASQKITPGSYMGSFTQRGDAQEGSMN